MEPDEIFSYVLVAEQLRDLLSLQHGRPPSVEQSEQRIEALELQLQAEQSAHGETSHALEEETRKLNFALGEIDILTRRLKDSHTTFNSRFGESELKATSELSEKKQLVEKCEELGITCCQQGILLSKKDDDIRELQQKLTKQKESHKREIAELRVQMQQEAYMTQMMSKGNASQSEKSLKHSKQR